MSMRTAKETDANVASYGFKQDENTGLHSDAADTLQLLAGGSELVEWTDGNYPTVTVPLTISGATGTGIKSSLLNPFGYDVMIQNATLLITTQAGQANTLDIGVGADATTSSDILFDGLSAAAAGPFSAGVDGGTNGQGCQLWSSTGYLNINSASGSAASLVATLRVDCVKV